jgi:glycosyltransferase involved in cell wall biosynthesis
MTPMVSVVIACRNAEATLGVQLSALSRQECPVPWNVVISDNGSTDRTVEVARSYATRLPDLVVIDSSDRAGAGHARNVGSRCTPAELLVFCDADDEAAPGWLAAMVAALADNQFVAGSFDATRLNDAGTLRSRTLQQSTGLQESPFGPGLPHAGAGNLGVTREAFFSVDGFDPTVGCLEDTDLCWRIQLAGIPLVFRREALMHVRLRSSLRGMWGQGKAYGMASALLEHRYPTPATAGGNSPAVTTRRRGADRIATVITLVRDQRSLGSLLWTLGWHVGHRQWRPSSADSPPAVSGDPGGPPPSNSVSAGGSQAVDAA